MNKAQVPTETNLLVAFTDLTQFARFSGTLPSWREVFQIMSDYFEFVGGIVEDAGGRLVKCMGDAAMLTFPEDKVDNGVLALHTIKEQGDKWCESRNMPCRHRIKAHFGPVIVGHIGSREDKRMDIYGETVNVAATLSSNGLAISPQAFRQLSQSTRKLFKKHTPPITYIPVDASHRD